MKRNGTSDPTHDDETVMNGAPKMVGGRAPAFLLALQVFTLHNDRVKTLVRLSLALVFIASVTLAGFLLYGPKEKDTFAVLTGLLAVIAAAIGAFPALRVVEIQEDALRPRPTPYFDLTSRYNLVQLRVKNIGGGVAYDVHLNWKTHPLDHAGKKVTSLDTISVLLPQDSASVLVGVSNEVVKEFSENRFEGECTFKDANGRKFREKFICSVDGNRKQLIHDDELPKALRDVQEIPKVLGRIADQLEKLRASE
jgi:hypothetical protein